MLKDLVMADQQDGLLCALPVEVGNSACTRLDFSGNNLSEVPDTLFSNSHLQVLNLAVCAAKMNFDSLRSSCHSCV